MKNPTKNQPSFAKLYKIFPFGVALWIYCHWDSIRTILGGILDTIILLVSLMLCFGLLLLGGAM